MDDNALRKLIAAYRREDAGRRAQTLAHYRNLPDLKTAVQNGAMAIGPDGKMSSHQRRIGYEKLKPFAAALGHRLAAIKACKTFAELHDLIESHRRPGIGALAIYDTATRIGAKLRLTPDAGYLHSGTKTGATNLGLGRGATELHRSDLPASLAEMDMDDVENFLCMFKKRFKGRRPNSRCEPPKQNRGIC